MSHIINDFVSDLFFENKKRSMGRNIHNEVMTAVLGAPINLFFDVTPIGMIINRIRSDIDVFRGHMLEIPRWICDMSSHFVYICILFIIMESYVYLGFILLVYLTIYIVQQPQLKVSKNLERIGHGLRSPIESFFHESMRGITVIRAFGQSETIIEKQYGLLDKSTSFRMVEHSCFKYGEAKVHFIAKMLNVISVIACVTNKGHIDNKYILQLLHYSDAGWIIWIGFCIKDFQNQVMRVQRILNLKNVPPEKVAGKQPDDPKWPAKGALVFDEVVLRYRPNTDIVLNKVSFECKPGEKVGVVGRTGAGKSTLTCALTRIVEMDSGRILIDGEDISKLNLNTLREKMTMIPQDPTLFSGTLRYNVDPFEEASDEQVTELLKKAGLDYLFEGKSKKEEEEEKRKKEEEEARKKEFNEEDDKKDDEKKDDDKKEDDKKDDEKKDEKEKTEEELAKEKKE